MIALHAEGVFCNMMLAIAISHINFQVSIRQLIPQDNFTPKRGSMYTMQIIVYLV